MINLAHSGWRAVYSSTFFTAAMVWGFTAKITDEDLCKNSGKEFNLFGIQKYPQYPHVVAGCPAKHEEVPHRVVVLEKGLEIKKEPGEADQCPGEDPIKLPRRHGYDKRARRSKPQQAHQHVNQRGNNVKSRG